MSRSIGVSEHLRQCLLFELDLNVQHEANLPFTPALSSHIPAPVSAVHRNQMAVSCSFLSIYTETVSNAFKMFFQVDLSNYV